ncbi:MAG: c-type cytochrome [Paracoccaceae bacterium]
MFNTMTITKIAGSIFGSLLVLLLINWAADVIYSTGANHGEQARSAHEATTETAAAGTSTEGSQATATSETAAPVVADAAKGAKVFSKCKACHKLEEGVNGVGPSLFGVTDRKIASTSFKYSNALKGLDGNWTAENLNRFLTSPKTFAPGTKMTFKGLKKDGDRANIIAYLATIGG